MICLYTTPDGHHSLPWGQCTVYIAETLESLETPQRGGESGWEGTGGITVSGGC